MQGDSLWRWVRGISSIQVFPRCHCVPASRMTSPPSRCLSVSQSYSFATVSEWKIPVQKDRERENFGATSEKGNRFMWKTAVISVLQWWWPGGHPGFSQGGSKFFHVCIVTSRVRKSALRKLFTMLQASSVLPLSKKHQKQTSKM